MESSQCNEVTPCFSEDMFIRRGGGRGREGQWSLNFFIPIPLFPISTTLLVSTPLCRSYCKILWNIILQTVSFSPKNPAFNHLFSCPLFFGVPVPVPPTSPIKESRMLCFGFLVKMTTQSTIQHNSKRNNRTRGYLTNGK